MAALHLTHQSKCSCTQCWIFNLFPPYPSWCFLQGTFSLHMKCINTTSIGSFSTCRMRDWSAGMPLQLHIPMQNKTTLMARQSTTATTIASTSAQSTARASTSAQCAMTTNTSTHFPPNLSTFTQGIPNPSISTQSIPNLSTSTQSAPNPGTSTTPP